MTIGEVSTSAELMLGKQDKKRCCR